MYILRKRGIGVISLMSLLAMHTATRTSRNTIFRSVDQESFRLLEQLSPRLHCYVNGIAEKVKC